MCIRDRIGIIENIKNKKEIKMGSQIGRVSSEPIEVDDKNA